LHQCFRVCVCLHLLQTTVRQQHAFQGTAHSTARHSTAGAEISRDRTGDIHVPAALLQQQQQQQQQLTHSTRSAACSQCAGCRLSRSQYTCSRISAGAAGCCHQRCCCCCCCCCSCCCCCGACSCCC
jgi:hypothetical protein